MNQMNQMNQIIKYIVIIYVYDIMGDSSLKIWSKYICLISQMSLNVGHLIVVLVKNQDKYIRRNSNLLAIISIICICLFYLSNARDGYHLFFSLLFLLTQVIIIINYNLLLSKKSRVIGSISAILNIVIGIVFVFMENKPEINLDLKSDVVECNITLLNHKNVPFEQAIIQHVNYILKYADHRIKAHAFFRKIGQPSEITKKEVTKRDDEELIITFDAGRFDENRKMKTYKCNVIIPLGSIRDTFKTKFPNSKKDFDALFMEQMKSSNYVPPYQDDDDDDVSVGGDGYYDDGSDRNDAMMAMLSD